MTENKKLILLTNDDGITAPGLVAMYRKLTETNEVQVVAPETVQSATGHGITLSGPLLTSKVDVENAFTGTAVAGSPADCVKLAISQILPRRHVIDISIGLGGTEWGIDQLAIVAGQGNGPVGKFFLEV